MVFKGGVLAKYTKFYIFLIGVCTTWVVLNVLPLFFRNLDDLMPFGFKLMLLQHCFFFCLTIGILRLPRSAVYPVFDDSDWRPMPHSVTLIAHFFATFIICVISFGFVDDEALKSAEKNFILVDKLANEKALNEQDLEQLEAIYFDSILAKDFTPFSSETVDRMSLSDQQQTLIDIYRTNPEYFGNLVRRAGINHLGKFDETSLVNFDNRVKRIFKGVVKGTWVTERIKKDLRKGILKSPSEIWTREMQANNIDSVRYAIEYFAVRNQVATKDVEQALKAAMKRNLDRWEKNYSENYAALRREADKWAEIHNMNIVEKSGLVVGQIGKRVTDLTAELFSPVVTTYQDFKSGVQQGIEE